jgi:hypothetical protein
MSRLPTIMCGKIKEKFLQHKNWRLLSFVCDSVQFSTLVPTFWLQGRFGLTAQKTITAISDYRFFSAIPNVIYHHQGHLDLCSHHNHYPENLKSNTNMLLYRPTGISRASFSLRSHPVYKRWESVTRLTISPHQYYQTCPSPSSHDWLADYLQTDFEQKKIYGVGWH